MVTSFGTSQNPICNFLSVINTNLLPISHRFPVIADGQICAKLSTTTFGSQETRNIALLYGIDIFTDAYFVLSTRLTDKQTERLP